ncbi:MAG: carbonic anhydrase [Rhodospirillaceae bacterium]|nr:MAG: carbonic anhydrase [Rhodospirillaceae bacterium]
MSPIIRKLIQGFAHFRERYFSKRQDLYARLVKDGQKPKVAVIACADSRVDPAIVLQVEPGDIFAIRNVANLIPPYKTEDDRTYHGTSAAVEFAVTNLDVDHIVVFGHAHCAGIQNMIDVQEGKPQHNHFVQQWTSIASKAYERAQAEKPGVKGEALARCCEKHAVLVSLENLRTFPFINDRLKAGTLEIHGWYLDIAKGELSSYDAASKTFLPLKSP